MASAKNNLKMAHAEGWIEAYSLLEEDNVLPEALKMRVLNNRNGIGETMLHWYCIEGEPKVIKQIINLGFDVNTTNDSRKTPLFECATIERWDVVELLLRFGADPYIKDHNDESIFDYFDENREFEKKSKLTALVSSILNCR